MNSIFIRGIYTPNVVPLNPDHRINEGELRRYTSWLIDKGISGLYPNGSTGEFIRLSFEERIRVVWKSWPARTEDACRSCRVTPRTNVSTGHPAGGRILQKNGRPVMANFCPAEEWQHDPDLRAPGEFHTNQPRSRRFKME